MKTNTLSVKKLTKNLILRALRQLYAVSEIIILIRWVTPPPKVEIPQLFIFFNFALSSLFPSFSSLAIYIYEFMSSTSFTYGYFFKLHFLLSECDRTLTSLCSLSQNSISPSHMHSIETVECLLCVLVSRRHRDNI